MFRGREGERKGWGKSGSERGSKSGVRGCLVREKGRGVTGVNGKEWGVEGLMKGVKGEGVENRYWKDCLREVKGRVDDRGEGRGRGRGW